LQIPESDSWYAGRLYCRFHKEIPLKGEVITIGTYHFVIEEATNKKIELVKMTVKTDFFSKSFFAK
jgi:Mg2+/Co2+ transporter CorC